MGRDAGIKDLGPQPHQIGNASISGDAGSWFLPDRVDLPFVTERDQDNNPISGLRRTQLAKFPARNWAAKWNAWLVLDEFVLKPWDPGGAKAALDNIVNGSNLGTELDHLVTAAQNERADAIGEILSQDAEFFSDFMGLLTITPGSYPKTYRVLHIASLIGSFTALHFKAIYERPRPSQLCPALLPPIPVPGHSSFPSGHSTQAHLMALCMDHLLTEANVPQPDLANISADLRVLADRIGRNREIAGLHYESDTAGGVALAQSVFDTLTNAPIGTFVNAINDAVEEWQ